MTIIRKSRLKNIYQPWEEYQAFCRVFWSQNERRRVLEKLGYSKHIIDLSSGFNLYPPPNVLMNKLQDDTRNLLFYLPYEAPNGQPFLVRSILAYELFRSPNARLTSENIVITTGTTWAFDCIGEQLVTSDPDGEVIIPVPNYSGFGLAMSRCGLQVVEVGSKDGPMVLPSIDEIRGAIGAKTKLIYVCPINNPTGTILSDDDVKNLLLLAKQHNLIIIWDETASTIIFPGTKLPVIWSLASNLDAMGNVIAIAGLSKDRSNPGHRIGWVISTGEIIQKIVKINLETYSVPASIFTGFVAKDMALRVLLLARERGITSDVAYNHFIRHFLGDFGPQFPTAAKLEIEFHEYLLDGIMVFLSHFEDKELLLDHSALLAQWHESLNERIHGNLSVLFSNFGSEIVLSSKITAGYNIFIKLSGLEHINPIHFTLASFYDAGVEILPGPVFGLLPGDWQELWGHCLRISLTQEPALFEEGLNRLLKFKQKLD